MSIEAPAPAQPLMKPPASHPPRPTQFDVRHSMADRPFERMLLLNRRFSDVLHAVGVAGFTAMVWPRFVAPFNFHVTRYPMPMANLHPLFQGYKILHLSDLHAGRVKPGYLHSVVEAGLAEEPDLVVITGDFIHYERDSLRVLGELLPKISAADGVLGIFGNHDYHEFSWRHVGERSSHRAIHKRLVKLLDKHHVTLLRNDRQTITRGDGKLHVVGMDELWVHNWHPEKAFAGVEPGQPCICLQHNPDGCALLQDYPWQWMLCGHSHGGQIDLPFLGPLYVPQENRKWTRGFFKFPDRHSGREKTMFVSTGIGYSTPVRLRVKPEVTVFTLAAGE